MNMMHDTIRRDAMVLMALLLLMGSALFAQEGYEQGNPSAVSREGVSSGAQEAGAVQASQESGGTEAAPGLTTFQHLLEFAGKFHPVMVHFPIALVLTCLLAEILGLLFGKSMFIDAARFLIVLGALSVAVTVPLGWMAAAFEDYSGDYARVLWWHRWLGTTAGVLVILTACLSEVSRSPRGGLAARTAYCAGLVVSAATMALTGHFGAMLIQGLDYFKWQ
jgi:uncharacterized membrane protein